MKNEVRPIDANALNNEVFKRPYIRANSGEGGVSMCEIDRSEKVKYAYPSSHIDREAWEDCPICGKYKAISFTGYRTKEDAIDIFRKSRPHVSGGAKFCPRCGKPRIPEAWAELEKRMGVRV